ncbi:hypothetical protein GDO78_016934 [Eleutherodactylus coqui]|uniref:Uncharacterized protein n=1 Tax=Eleutherodactylus coqui TaxID=57060 RepID=A0A8J6JRZ0_ELECQ|nr:hypothetical protein GDO78_016934 [Eleutherodactylus coqui]
MEQPTVYSGVAARSIVAHGVHRWCSPECSSRRSTRCKQPEQARVHLSGAARSVRRWSSTVVECEQRLWHFVAVSETGTFIHPSYPQGGIIQDLLIPKMKEGPRGPTCET